MRCSSCGAEIPDGVKFCPSCGATQPAAAPPVYAQPPQPQYAYQAPTAPPPPPLQQPKPKTTGQIIFSIINILCCYGSLFGIIALIFSIMASSSATYEDGKKKLKTAKTLNIIAIILSVLGFIITLAAGLLPMILAAASGDFNWDYSGY
jgi:hypothetical protein